MSAAPFSRSLLRPPSDGNKTKSSKRSTKAKAKAKESPVFMSLLEQPHYLQVPPSLKKQKVLMPPILLLEKLINFVVVEVI